VNATDPVRCSIWARVSTSDQKTGNQLHELREWARRRGLEVTAEFTTEDSAWADGTNGVKGKEFDKARADLLNGARLGHYQVCLIWALDRLSRKGIEDTLATLRRLTEHDCTVWSLQQPWVQSMTDPGMREVFIALESWKAQAESTIRSARIKAGMARRKREGKPVGGRVAGAKDRRKRSGDGYAAAWAPGGALRVARDKRLAEKRATPPQEGSQPPA
jgi:putative DNA-invertase from lambdoid prophage Rac